jgi:hypothetical protein
MILHVMDKKHRPRLFDRSSAREVLKDLIEYEYGEGKSLTTVQEHAALDLMAAARKVALRDYLDSIFGRVARAYDKKSGKRSTS